VTGPEAKRGGPGPVQLERLLESDPNDLYENAPCGYLSMVPDGRIVKVNATFCAWTGLSADTVRGRRLTDLLGIGSRVFVLTHLWPLLRMQGAVQEIALDVVRFDGTVLPCLFNAVEVRDDNGAPLLVRATVFDATARRRYEQDLLAAQRRAEASEQRSRSLQQVVSDLAAATSVAGVAAVIVEHGRAVAGARGAALVLRDELPPRGDDEDADAEPDLHTESSVGLPPELIRELRTAAGGQVATELSSGVRTVELDDRLREVRPGVAAAMVAGGLAALQLVPVTADARRLGMLVLGIADADGSGLISLDEPGSLRSTEPADRDALETLGQQAGQALERARLHEDTARQAERSAFLLEAARLLASASDLSDTVERLAELAVTRLADLCTIDLESEDGTLQRVVRHRDPARQYLADELRAVAQRRGEQPSRLALREGRTVWIRRLDDELDTLITDPRRLAVTRELALTSLISVPFHAEGRVLGALTLAGDVGRPRFTAADVDVVEQLALQVALVIAKAQRYELDVRASHTLQANLLPPSPPVLDGLSTAVRYLTATHGVEVGGDFYDVVALPDGQVALAVGDVVGHDITAAATMGQLTSVYRALLADRPSPGALIDRLQAGWALLGLKRMATAMFATLDPASGQLRIASAGHLPPLLLVDGRAEVLPVRPGRMLGAPPAPTVEWAGVLPRGATLVLFTDGLVESRTADIDEGMAELIAVTQRAATSNPDALCDLLLAELTGAHRDDDIALLVLTRHG
jgi:serine/threonine-protein kinase RsbW